MSIGNRVFFGDAHYEDLWEDLMQYTEYRSVDQMTDKDIPKFYYQVNQDSLSKGRKPPFRHGRQFQTSMTDAWFRKKKFGDAGGKSPRQDRQQTANVVPPSQYKDAQHQDMKRLDTKAIQHKSYTVRGSQIRQGTRVQTYSRLTFSSSGKTLYRDNKGRFVRVKR